MKTAVNTTQNSRKTFSVKALDKDQLKARSFDTVRTSFAIEGIRFSESKFAALKTGSHLKK